MRFCALLPLVLLALPAAAAPCDALAQMRLKQGKVTLAAEFAPGAFTPPVGNAAPYRNLPAFCRVAATLTPTEDSDVKIEVWLPVQAGWNKTLQSVGNGAWAGSLSYAAMAGALAAGYATASTDTGHTGNTPAFATGHPEKFNDFAYRAIHEMTVAAKEIVKAYYGAPAAHSYFNGCSTGGRQALMEAQRYPADYDGIIAGAPAISASQLQAMQIWAYQQANAGPAAVMTKEKYATLHNAVLAACDRLDGVTDGQIENPQRCKFDPASLACSEGDRPDCLTREQVAFAKRMYEGPNKSVRAGLDWFPGLEPGSETGWTMIADRRPMAFAEELYRLSLADAAWNADRFDWFRDVPKATKALAKSLDADDPDLRPFFKRGGKLILYHGWADPGIPPGNTLEYRKRVINELGAQQAEAGMRLYMVPAMGHCRGGGTDTFDLPAALTRWVEHGEAPSAIQAARLANGKVNRTRPLCPFPQQAIYSGTGNTDDAASFSCRLP